MFIKKLFIVNNAKNWSEIMSNEKQLLEWQNNDLWMLKYNIHKITNLKNNG